MQTWRANVRDSARESLPDSSNGLVAFGPSAPLVSSLYISLDSSLGSYLILTIYDCSVPDPFFLIHSDSFLAPVLY